MWAPGPAPSFCLCLWAAHARPPPPLTHTHTHTHKHTRVLVSCRSRTHTQRPQGFDVILSDMLQFTNGVNDVELSLELAGTALNVATGVRGGLCGGCSCVTRPGACVCSWLTRSWVAPRCLAAWRRPLTARGGWLGSDGVFDPRLTACG
jgi:hypothetical protein